jgi:hypothetical protein
MQYKIISIRNLPIILCPNICMCVIYISSTYMSRRIKHQVLRVQTEYCSTDYCTILNLIFSVVLTSLHSFLFNWIFHLLE